MNTYFQLEQFSIPFSIFLLFFRRKEKKKIFRTTTREKTIPTAHRLDPTSIVGSVENNIQSREQYGGISEQGTEFSGLIPWNWFFDRKHNTENLPSGVGGIYFACENAETFPIAGEGEETSYFPPSKNKREHPVVVHRVFHKPVQEIEMTSILFYFENKIFVSTSLSF